MARGFLSPALTMESSSTQTRCAGMDIDTEEDTYTRPPAQISFAHGTKTLNSDEGYRGTISSQRHTNERHEHDPLLSAAAQMAPPSSRSQSEGSANYCSRDDYAAYSLPSTSNSSDSDSGSKSWTGSPATLDPEDDVVPISSTPDLSQSSSSPWRDCSPIFMLQPGVGAARLAARSHSNEAEPNSDVSPIFLENGKVSYTEDDEDSSPCYTSISGSPTSGRPLQDTNSCISASPSSKKLLKRRRDSQDSFSSTSSSQASSDVQVSHCTRDSLSYTKTSGLPNIAVSGPRLVLSRKKQKLGSARRPSKGILTIPKPRVGHAEMSALSSQFTRSSVSQEEIHFEDSGKENHDYSVGIEDSLLLNGIQARLLTQNTNSCYSQEGNDMPAATFSREEELKYMTEDLSTMTDPELSFTRSLYQMLLPVLAERHTGKSIKPYYIPYGDDLGHASEDWDDSTTEPDYTSDIRVQVDDLQEGSDSHEKQSFPTCDFTFVYRLHEELEDLSWRHEVGLEPRTYFQECVDEGPFLRSAQSSQSSVTRKFAGSSPVPLSSCSDVNCTGPHAFARMTSELAESSCSRSYSRSATSSVEGYTSGSSSLSHSVSVSQTSSTSTSTIVFNSNTSARTYSHVATAPKRKRDHSISYSSSESSLDESTYTGWHPLKVLSHSSKAHSLSTSRTGSMIRIRSVEASALHTLDETPPTKRARIEKAEHSLHALSRSSFDYFAREPASIRRAKSLRSEASVCEKDAFQPPGKENRPVETKQSSPQDSQLQYIRSSLHSFSSGASESCPPTVPASPIRQRNRGALGSDSRTPLAIPWPVPPIAPPPFEYIPRPPFNDEDAAERRLVVLLNREKKERREDGLLLCVKDSEAPREGTDEKSSKGDEDKGVADDESESDVDSEELWEDESDAEKTDNEKAREQEVRPTYRVDQNGEVNERGKYNNNGGALNSCTKEEWDEMTGIDDELKMEVIEWILEVLPSLKCNLKIRSMTSEELHDQLSNSPETRFYAGLLFVRYFWRIAGASETSHVKKAEAKNTKERDAVRASIQEGRRRVIWDVAVGCLALSVKFHRDFLYPLYPVYAREFLALAPHPMSYDDLETAQRDILEAFSYSLGNNTPSAFMEEIYNSLLSLRKLLDFQSAWEMAQKETWERLFSSLFEPEILRYPVSLLTVSALIDSIVDVLVEKYDGDRRLRYSCKGDRNLQDEIRELERYRREAVERSSGVVSDVLELLGISKDDLDSCRAWMASVVT